MNDFEYQQQLLRRLAQLSDERILWRMQQLGYWQGNLPPDPPAEISERTQLQSELNSLQQSALIKGDVESALKAERKRRFKESLARRAEAKAAKARAKADAQQAFATFKDTQILHLGKGVSAGLQLDPAQAGNDADEVRKILGAPDKLRALNLPVAHSADSLALSMGLSLKELRWLSFHREAAPMVHYARFSMPKKSGGMRFISAPKPKLKKAQQWIFWEILRKLDVSPHAHGFVSARSSVSNAEHHCGRKVLINLDLQDFFPSIGFVRVRELFVSFGYARRVATVLALLCTEPPRVAGKIAGDVKNQCLHVAVGERALPQGACTSPIITNLLCRRLDRRLHALAQKFGFTYTRYADDLSFSGDDVSRVGSVLAIAKRVVKEEGFVVNANKTKVMHCSQKQEVTGLTVNSIEPKLPRAEKRRLRAMLHNAATRGMDAANINKLPYFNQHLRGWVAYASMAEPHRAPIWQGALAAIASA